MFEVRNPRLGAAARNHKSPEYLRGLAVRTRSLVIGHWSLVLTRRSSTAFFIQAGLMVSGEGAILHRDLTEGTWPTTNDQRRFFYNPLPWTWNKSCMN